MNQAGELCLLLERLSGISSDVLIYTGYRIEELRAMRDPNVDRLLREISVLIDGEYREELNDGSFLRGSSNQRIHILDPLKREQYQRYLETGHNQIQNFTTTDGVVSVGIHHRSF